ncbi:unnamed protein product [Soboliphyme baturini]|uniref:Uncharacterized protein n=1 Tax=Soboliphyme baturini TaxID=241478 RepID=A0A183I8S8_9BILA|nr:unnamed protein product [Soboliphyme baturini]
MKPRTIGNGDTGWGFLREQLFYNDRSDTPPVQMALYKRYCQPLRMNRRRRTSVRLLSTDAVLPLLSFHIHLCNSSEVEPQFLPSASKQTLLLVDFIQQ